MTTSIQTHRENSITRIAGCHNSCHVSLCTRMRLHVNIIGIFAVKYLLPTLLAIGFQQISRTTTTIITFTGITLGILTGKAASHSSTNSRGRIVFRSNQFDIPDLTIIFHLNDLSQICHAITNTIFQQDLNVLIHLKIFHYFNSPLYYFLQYDS